MKNGASKRSNPKDKIDWSMYQRKRIRLVKQVAEAEHQVRMRPMQRNREGGNRAP